MAVALDETRFARSFDSFAMRMARVMVETDASLWGTGCFSEDGTERCVGGSAASLAPLEFGNDSLFQNLAELSA